MRRTLKQGEVSFSQCKRGLLVTEVGEHTAAYYYIPRSNYVSVTEGLGSSVQVKFGKGTLMLTMPDSMWATWGDDILAAALGEDAV